MKFMENLGQSISKKEIVIEKLSKGGYVVIGTPKLDRDELAQVIGICQHEIRYRDKKIKELSKKK